MNFAVPEVLWRYMDGLKRHDVEQIGSTVAEDLAFITPSKVLNKQQFLAMLQGLYAGFPDWHYDHDAPEFREDCIAVKWRQGGTHTGRLKLPGFKPVPATNRKVQIPEHYFFYKVSDDHILAIQPEPVPGGAPLGIFDQITDKP